MDTVVSGARGAPSHRTATAALVRFHLASGVRIALRAASLKLFIGVVALAVSGDAAAILRQLALGLAGAGGWSLAPLLFAAWVAVDCRLAVHRMAPALRGWHLHLPVDETGRRRALIVSLLVAQLPVLCIWLILWFGALLTGPAVRPLSLAALPVVAGGAVWLALPLERRRARILGGAALLLGGTAAPLALAVSVPCLAAAAALSGPLATRAGGPRPATRDPARGWLEARIVLRAVGRELPAVYLLTALPLAATVVFLLNNEELGPAQAGLGIRLGCGLAIVWLQSELAGRLKIARPPWGWARSLPGTSRRRVLRDAAFLALAGLPFAAAGGWLSPATLGTSLALLAYAALRLATAVRKRRDQRTAIGGPALLEIVGCALWVGVTAWAGVFLAALLPWAAHAAVRTEQRVKVGLWVERDHTAAGDPA